MNTKKKYTAPAVCTVSIKSGGNILSASTEMQVFTDTETDTEDVQYARRSYSVWD